MGVIGRAFHLLHAKSNEWLHGQEKDNAGAQAQDAADKIQKQTAELTTGVAQAIATMEGVADQKKVADKEAAKWDLAARTFLQQNNEKAATEAVDRENAAKRQSATFEAQIEAQQKRIETYKEKVQEMQRTSQDAQSQAAAIAAQQQIVDAESKIKSEDPNSAINQLNQAQADVNQRQRTQDAQDDLDGTNLQQQATDIQRQQQDAATLAELKKQMGVGQTPAAPAQPATVPSNGQVDGFNVAK